MHYVERVEIEGFWGDRKASINFHRDVNFLIGENGTGKTNLINMIASALSADFSMLDRLPFNSIRIFLKQRKGNKKPRIEVIKQLRKNTPFSSIVFSIHESANGEPRVFTLNDIEEERSIRHAPHHYRAVYQKYRNDISDSISSLFGLTWLSIHRSTGWRQGPEERSFESTVDRKLSDLQERFIRYFSMLQKRSADEMAKFQETIFLSLLHDAKETALIASVKSLDLKAEEKSLSDIFRRFNVPEAQFMPKLNRHFQSLRSLEEKPSGWVELFTSINMWRIHSVVQEWTKVGDRQRAIFEARNNFIRLLNGMMNGKEIKISESNDIYALTTSGKKLLPFELSSGEKQLVILLGEALLQESSPWIYIADEPELSLHVKWQEALVKNMMEINPNCQVICATHSPDVAGPFGNRIIHMEDVFK